MIIKNTTRVFFHTAAEEKLCPVGERRPPIAKLPPDEEAAPPPTPPPPNKASSAVFEGTRGTMLPTS